MGLDDLKVRKDLMKFLFCCGLVEDYVSRAYRSLASRLDDGLVKVMLDYIADDSMKHSKILIGISKYFGVSEISLNECEKMIGSTATDIIKDAERASAETDKISLKKLISEFDKLIDLEKYFGEEYFMMIQLKSFTVLLEYEKLDVGFIKEILEYISEDERRHVKILEFIKILASQ